MINLERPGQYKLDFYYYMYCNLTGCENSGDSISILIDPETDQSIKQAYLLRDIKKEKVWIKDSMIFSSNKETIKVILYLIIFFLKNYLKNS